MAVKAGHRLDITSYAAISILCITSFVRASTLNPGALHVTQESQGEWTLCRVCGTGRPPMSHHCRRCGQCVRRMDHHCPWINNCVGEENQFSFMLLLLYAFLLSLATFLIDIVYFVWLEDCVTCNKESFAVRHQSAVVLVGAFLAVLMMFSSFGLFFTQHINIIHELPTVEWMKIQREMLINGVKPPAQILKESRPVLDVYEDVCGTRSLLLWPFPCRRRRPALQSAGATGV